MSFFQIYDVNVELSPESSVRKRLRHLALMEAIFDSAVTHKLFYKLSLSRPQIKRNSVHYISK